MIWTEYWNGPTTVYVNGRHERVHYEAIALDVLKYVPERDARVVDFGCGDALFAGRVADACAQLFLCDSAPRVRERLANRYADRQDISIISPHQFERLPSGSIDLIVANSVVQYLSASEFANLVTTSRDKLNEGGRLVLADVIPRSVGPLADATELLRFALTNNFFLSAAAGLVRSYFSSYRQVREKLGVLQFDEAELLNVLAQAGFVAHRHYHNIGHNSKRMTFLAVPNKAKTVARTLPVPEFSNPGYSPQTAPANG